MVSRGLSCDTLRITNNEVNKLRSGRGLIEIISCNFPRETE
jgi:hypothetical protein